MKLTSLLALSTMATAPLPVMAQQPPADGTYDATVSTASGKYSVPVKVEDGAVTAIQWPNGGRMRVRNGELDDGSAAGTTGAGDAVKIEMDEPASDEDGNEQEPPQQ